MAAEYRLVAIRRRSGSISPTSEESQIEAQTANLAVITASQSTSTTAPRWEVVGEIQYLELNINLRLVDPSDFDFRISAESLASPTLSALDMDVIIYRNDEPLVRGVITAIREEFLVDGHYRQVLCNDYRGVLRRRNIVKELDYENESPQNIAWSVIEHIQEQKNGDLGIVRGIYPPSKPYSEVTATGGTISTVTIDGTTWKVHKFSSVGETNFDVTAVDGEAEIEYLIVGGGGGGGASNIVAGTGGGGAGGVIQGATRISSTGVRTVVVGDGGAGGAHATPTAGSNGSPSSVFGVVAAGGGGGGKAIAGDNTANNGLDGASGGGAGGSDRVGRGGFGTVDQGNDGGSSFASSTDTVRAGGGGGGRSEAGRRVRRSIQDGTGKRGRDSFGGDGGDGLLTFFTGEELYFGGGGGGGGSSTITPGKGGLGGGGNGGKGATSSPTNGAANTGGGGGGGSTSSVSGERTAGGAGGSGVVYLRYRTSDGYLTGGYELGSSAYDAIELLREYSDGVDWDITPDLEFNTWDRRGNDRQRVLDYGGAMSSMEVEFSVDQYANAVRVVGAEAIEPVVLVSDDRRFGRWDRDVSYRDISDSKLLLGIALDELDTATEDVRTFDVRLRSGLGFQSWGGPGDIGLGDTVVVEVQTASASLRERQRVYEIDVTVRSDGAEDVRLTLNAPKATFSQRIERILRRIKKLEQEAGKT